MPRRAGRALHVPPHPGSLRRRPSPQAPEGLRCCGVGTQHPLRPRGRFGCTALPAQSVSGALQSPPRAGENGKRFAERTAKIPPPPQHCSWAERGDGCSSSYLLQVLLRPGTGVLWQDWLRFQSRGARALAACSFLPVFWLNLGAGNGVRQGRSSLLGRRAGEGDRQGAKTPRKAGASQPQRSQENIPRSVRASEAERAG